MFKHCFLLTSLVLFTTSMAQAGTPRLTRIVPLGGQRGTTVEVMLQGRYLDKPEEVLVYEPGITVESIEAIEGNIEIRGYRGRVEAGAGVRVKLKVADDCPLGVHEMRLRTATGLSEFQRFVVGPFATIEEDERTQQARNDKRETSQPVPLNSTVLGRMMDPTDVDLFRIEAKQGQRLSAEIEAVRLGVDQGIPDLHLSLLDAEGKRLIAADDSALFLQDPIVSMIAPQDGTYFVEVRHATYSAANDVYRLHVGSFARPTGLFPAGGPAGKELSVRVLGDPKGDWSQTVTLPVEHAARVHEGSTRAAYSTNFRFVAVDSESNVPAPTPNTLRVSPFDNVLEAEPNDSEDVIKSQSAASLPIAFNGIIEKSGDVDCFRFTAKKGERFKVHCLANALGSPLDPTIWIKQVGAKGSPQRATDSRPNQLGYPPFGGMNRDTLDPCLDFTAAADGEYVLGVEDDRGNGGADFVYRVEISPEIDAVYVYIPQDGEAAFQPQSRQSISVPSGGRYNTQLSIINTNRPFNGELELVALGLPEGVTMHAPRVTPAMPRVPVVFEAAADAKLQGKFIEIVARPVRSTDGSPVSEAEADGQASLLPHVVSGFRQSIPMSASGNNDYYVFNTFEKLAIAVTEPAPFSIEVEEPKSALVQNGEISLKFKIVRAVGFDEAVSVAMEWKPSGVSTGTPITIRTEKSEGEYLLGAARNATAGSYQVTLSAVSGAQRPAYRDGANRTYVSTKPIKLLVAEPHIDAKFARASIERGKTANLTVKLNHLKPFEGKAKTTLTRLPRGVELVEPFREITSEDKEVTFTLKATDECLTGGYQGITLETTVLEDGQSVKQLSGYGTLRIDAERGVKAAMK
ncbi:MAG: pre-peptidase C-terminal domain-containing protein [Planctomycetaceae bacterium]